MTTSRSLVVHLTSIVAGATFAVSVALTSAYGQMCDNAMPPRVDLAQGYAFTGTLIGARITQTTSTYDFLVDRVITNGLSQLGVPPSDLLKAGEVLHEVTSECGAVTNLQVDKRYLVSAGYLVSFQSYYTAVWLISGARVTLVRMYGDRDFDPKLAAVDTIDEAVALITTGALPETATSGDDPHSGVGDMSMPAVVAVAIAAIAAAAALGLNRKIRLASRD